MSYLIYLFLCWSSLKRPTLYIACRRRAQWNRWKWTHKMMKPLILIYDVRPNGFQLIYKLKQCAQDICTVIYMGLGTHGGSVLIVPCSVGDFCLFAWWTSQRLHVGSIYVPHDQHDIDRTFLPDLDPVAFQQRIPACPWLNAHSAHALPTSQHLIMS